MKEKVNIALGYYKKVMTDKILKLNAVEEVHRDTFISHVNHTDLNRMLKEKLINKHQYDELNQSL